MNAVLFRTKKLAVVHVPPPATLFFCLFFGEGSGVLQRAGEEKTGLHMLGKKCHSAKYFLIEKDCNPTCENYKDIYMV